MKTLFIEETEPPAVPAEAAGGLAFGLFAHLGPAVAFVTILSLTDMALVPAVVSFVVLSLLNLFLVLYVERAAPSVELPPPTWADVRRGLGLVFLEGVVGGGAVVITGWWLLSGLSPLTGELSGWAPIFAVVLLTDAVYYWIHRSLNHARGAGPIRRWFRRRHVAHHSVSELDFLRGNVSSFFDTAVTGFQVPLAVLTAVAGMDLGATLIAYSLVLMLQATHHVNHTFHLGWARYVFMDNHAHKLHHCKRGRLVNHGALFSLWDRAFGTYYENWDLRANHLASQRIPLPLRPRPVAR